MKNKVLSAILFLFVICISISIGTNIIFAHATEIGEIDSYVAKTEYYRNVNKSVELYVEVLKPYVSKVFTRSGEETLYDDNFAGAYIDENGLLNIGVVGVEKIERQHNEQVIIRPQTFSYNYLWNIQSEITKIMQDFKISATAIDEKANKVEIYLTSDEEKHLIMDYLLSNSLCEKDIINFIVDKDNSIIPTANIAYGGDKLNLNGF